MMKIVERFNNYKGVDISAPFFRTAGLGILCDFSDSWMPE
jgi:hypothetical protein